MERAGYLLKATIISILVEMRIGKYREKKVYVCYKRAQLEKS